MISKAPARICLFGDHQDYLGTSLNQIPGGNNTTWDWSDFKNTKKLPYILSGGLNVTIFKGLKDIVLANPDTLSLIVSIPLSSEAFI